MSASVLLCHGCLLKNSSATVEGFGGNLIQVFTLSKPPWKECAGSGHGEPPIPFSPFGTADPSCPSLLGSTGKCLAYLSRWIHGVHPAFASELHELAIPFRNVWGFDGVSSLPIGI